MSPSERHSTSPDRSPTGATSIQIDHFVVLQRIGAGAMGEVYAAYDTHLDRKVAIKLVRRDGHSASAQLEPRLLREAKTLAQVSHPNVVQVYAAGIHDDQLYIAMEFIHGTTLTEWLAELDKRDKQSKRRRLRAIVEIFTAAGRGLEAAHEAGLVHRDFKPDNVLVGDDGRPRVVDFGLARTIRLEDWDSGVSALTTAPQPSLQRGSDGQSTVDMAVGALAETAPLPAGGSLDEYMPPMETEPAAIPLQSDSKLQALGLINDNLTRADMLVGTPRYMSPEQMRCQSADGRSDQFSFCVALHEALSGSSPFSGKSLTSRRRSVLKDEPRPLTGAVPAHVRNALMRGMAKDPDQRFPDMGSLLTALDMTRRSHRRRRLLTVGIIATLLVALLYLTVTRQPEPIRPCASVNDDIERLWTDQRRAAFQGALASDTFPSAGIAWTHAEERIASYLEDLKRVRQEVCTAHHNQPQAPGLYDRQAICLARGLAHLSAFMSSVENINPDIDTARRIVDIASSLPEYSVCLEVTAVYAPDPPDSQEARAAVAGIREKLAQVEIDERLGRLREAAELAEQQIEQSTSIDYPPVRAEALYHAARVRARQRDTDSANEAFSLLMDAIDLAEIHRHDSLARAAWSEAVELAITGLHDDQRARDWGRRAMAVVKRTGDDPVERARVLWLRGRMRYLLTSEFEDAVKDLQAAVKLVATDGARDNWEMAVYLGDLANALRLRGGFQEAETYHRQGIDIVTRLLGQANPALARLQQDFGAGLIEQGQFERADVFLGLAVQSYKDSYGEGHLELGRVYCNLAEVTQRSGRWQRARDYVAKCRRIYEVSVPPDVKRRAKPDELMGVIEQGSKNYERAIDYQRAAGVMLDKARDREEYDIDVALNHMNLAQSLVELGRFDVASVELDKAEKILNKSDAANGAYRGFVQMLVGRVSLARGQTARAISLLQKSLTGLDDGAPMERATALFALAQARYQHAPEDVEDAVELAEQARKLYLKLGGASAEITAIQTWLDRVRPATR